MLGVTFALIIRLYYIYVMYPLQNIFYKENHNNSEYRKKAENIIEKSTEPIKAIKKFAEKKGTPSAYINTAIPLIKAVQRGLLSEEDLPSAEEFLSLVDKILFNHALTPPNVEDQAPIHSYRLARPNVCIPFYFDASQILVSKYLWPQGFLLDPMYFFLPDFSSFKEQLDKYLQPIHNDYSRYKILERLRTNAINSVSYLQSKTHEVEAYQPYLKKYCSTIKTAKSKAKDIQYIAESYLAPLLSTSVADLKGNLKDVLPTWEQPHEKLEALYKALKGKYIDKRTPKKAFFELFSGKMIYSFKYKITWIDKNPKNQEPSSKTILRLFKILAFNNFIDIRYASNRKLVLDIAHGCFLVGGKPPKRSSMSTALSKITGSSPKYKEVQSIVNSI